jgi:hypothetical protein
MTMFEQFLTDEAVQRLYAKAGGDFGDAYGYMPKGSPVCGGEFFAEWKKWEAEYARRGYRTLPLQAFIRYGHYGEKLTGLGVKRAPGEEAILWAEGRQSV